MILVSLKVKILRILQELKKISGRLIFLSDISQLVGFITDKKPSLCVLLLEYSRRSIQIPGPRDSRQALYK